MNAPQPARRFVAYLWTGNADGDLSGQRESIQRYAQAHGLTATTEFSDRGVAGDSGLRARPRLGDLLLAAAGGNIELALVESAERLSHDAVQREFLLHELRRAGVTVLAVGSGEELTGGGTDPTAALIQRVLGAVAEFDAHPSVTALRTAAADRRNAACGQKALDEIRRLRAQRASFSKIARHLNNLGLLDPKGRPWTRMAAFEFQR